MDGPFVDYDVKFNYSIESIGGSTNFIINHSLPTVNLLKNNMGMLRRKIEKYLDCEADLRRHLIKLKMLLLSKYKEYILIIILKKLFNRDLIMVAPMCNHFFNLHDQYMFTFGKIFYTRLHIKLECLIFFDLNNNTLFLVHKTLDDYQLAEFISSYLTKYGLKQIELRVNGSTETQYMEHDINDLDDYVCFKEDPIVIDANNKFKDLKLYYSKFIHCIDSRKELDVKLKEIRNILKRVKCAHTLNANKENENGLQVDVCKIMQDAVERITIINNKYMIDKVRKMSKHLDDETDVSPAKRKKINVAQQQSVEEPRPFVHENPDDFNYTHPPISCMFNLQCDRSSLNVTTLMIFSKNSSWSKDYADDDDKNTKRVGDIKKLINSKNFKMFKPFLKRQYEYDE
nr:hypothetical protein [Spodoptera litura nucleopolyhedrovirus]